MDVLLQMLYRLVLFMEILYEAMFIVEALYKVEVVRIFGIIKITFFIILFAMFLANMISKKFKSHII